MKTSLAVVEKFYRLLANNQTDDALSLLDDDFVLVQAASLPYGGGYRGKEGIKQFFTKFFTVWKGFRSDDVTYFVNEDKVVATSCAIATTHQGVKFEMPMAQIYTVRNGKMLRTEPFYLDTAVLNQLFDNS